MKEVCSEQLGVRWPRTLLPRQGVDLSRFSVIACDQYTSQPEYWHRAAQVVGEHASALSLVLPEVFLGAADEGQRIEAIHAAMQRYLDEGLLDPLDAPVYVKRQTTAGVRHGLVLEIDLERYDYAPGSQALIRATEGTVVERIPPRLRVREGAALELPHVMLLIDDPQNAVLGPLEGLQPPLYSFELMLGGGHLSGYRVDEKAWQRVLDALYALYTAQGDHPMLFAVGDGNHSLATAKTHWENLKRAGADPESHPARWALVEVVNLHDPALVFEPIHRVLFMPEEAGAIGLIMADTPGEGRIPVTMVTKDGDRIYYLGAASAPHAVGELDALLAHRMEAQEKRGRGGWSLDYVHGEAAVRELVQQGNAIGFLLPAMQKAELFPAVRAGGALPRKTFSMGEADDKRFYLEARGIVTQPQNRSI